MGRCQQARDGESSRVDIYVTTCSVFAWNLESISSTVKAGASVFAHRPVVVSAHARMMAKYTNRRGRRYDSHLLNFTKTSSKNVLLDISPLRYFSGPRYLPDAEAAAAAADSGVVSLLHRLCNRTALLLCNNLQSDICPNNLPNSKGSNEPWLMHIIDNQNCF